MSKPLSADDLARMEQNKLEALAKIERNRLLRLEQQQNQVLNQNQNQNQNYNHQNHQNQSNQNQNYNQNQNKKQLDKSTNREHYKQASLEEKQIQARVNYKTHQKTGVPSGKGEIWTEKKKKDELLVDTMEYQLVQQRLDTYCNDMSMVVVNMDTSNPGYIHSKNKKPTPTITATASDVASSYDEWTGLVSQIGKMNRSGSELGGGWVKKTTPKEDSEGEPTPNTHDNFTVPSPIQRSSSGSNNNINNNSSNNINDYNNSTNYNTNNDNNNQNSHNISPLTRNNSTPPISRSNSMNGDDNGEDQGRDKERDNKTISNGNKTPPISRNNSGDNIAINSTHVPDMNNNNKTPQNTRHSSTSSSSSAYPSTPGHTPKNFYSNLLHSLNSPTSSPVSSGTTSSPATPTPPPPSPSPSSKSSASPSSAKSTASPSSSTKLNASPSSAKSTTSPSSTRSAKSTPASTPNHKAFKKATPSSNSSSSSTSSTTKTVQQKIKFTSVTLNAKAKIEEDTSHHRIPDTVLKQGYLIITTDEQRRNLMAPCTPLAKKKGSERAWVSWCVVYANGHTSFRKSSSTPAKRKKVAQTVPSKPDALGVCFYRTSSKGGEPLMYVIPLSQKTTRQENMEFFYQFLEAEEVCKVCYNTQDGLKVILEEYPKLTPRNCVDPQIAAWVSNPESVRYFFPDIVRFYISKISKFEKHPQSGLMASHELISIDQWDSLALMDHLLVVLEEDKLLCPLQDEMDLIPVLSQMEMGGIGFNAQVLEPCKEAITEKLDTIKAEAEKLISYPINFNSPQSVANVLFDVLKLQVPQDKYSGKKFANTKKGNRSTSEAILKKLESQHKLPSMILEYRHCQKLLSTWVDSLVTQTRVDQEGNLRIHAHWISNGTSTGRLASTDPNLQNIPKSKMTMNSITFNVRDSFCASEGWVLIGADYSQIELRVLAHISRDPTLLSFFGEGVDVLKMVASHWMGKSVEEITAEDRDYTKRIVYGILYGIGAPSLASMLKVSIGEATKFMSTFLGKFPKVQHFIDSTVSSAKKEKFVRTITGRLRRLPHINAGGGQGQQALRQAVNTVIQGTAADVVKTAMIGVNNVLKQNDKLYSSVRLLLQIHDELVYEVKEDVVVEFLEIMQKTMIASLDLSVPLTLSVKTGKNWGSMIPLDSSSDANDNLQDEDDESLLEEFEYNNGDESNASYEDDEENDD